MPAPTGRPFSTKEPSRTYKRKTAALVTAANVGTEKVGGPLHRTVPHGPGELRTPTGTNAHLTSDAVVGSLRSVTDGVLNTTTTVTSATAAFTGADVGASVVGTGIPGGATIASVTNATTVVLSAAATATASAVTLTISKNSTSLTSATFGFDANDTGATVTGTGIPGGTTITSVSNATTAVMSANSTTVGSGVTITVTRSALRYVALRPMKVNGVQINPGTVVPQANGWRNLHNYLSTGHLAVIGS